MTHYVDQAALINRFRELTEGNWRNAFYICCAVCPYEKISLCGDFLFVPDETGRPFLLPTAFARRAFGTIDWSECLGQISNLMFRELYRRWFEAEILRPNVCPFWDAVIRQSGPKRR